MTLGLLIKWLGFVFVTLALLSIGWSFVGLFTDKKWIKAIILTIITIVSIFIITKMGLA